ncbi:MULTISPECIES: TatD family hydrolase [Comamonas]|uniref:TatD family hydrolase n=1 Tax=Comamonas TaxID=283 RepID=UPI001C44EEA1|nr:MULTISPECIES: TatD family hydrolase [Comamonas]MBV7420951.1 TatD family hydrolase [Comamonas sp. CMM03]MDH0051396.1 TatD family hydrolase [Comamonas terrigena]MDH0512786.1 TatD family hydrolase [Comamonas terrigena]MDH1093347.1 TatD family hydrolase [Comamonas terrigena]MDH1503326.1 TatD family hydrolase [Comamonas terrigena]
MSCWIDTHCHLDAPEFDADRDAVRAAARARGVEHIVIPAVERAHWSGAIALAQRHGDSYALGIHPLYTPRAQEADIAALRAVLAERQGDPQLVAVGEIGLDFFVPGLDHERQIWFYEQQIQLARTFGLPVILHVRKSSDRLLKTLRATPVVGGIAHAFNGSAQQAQAFIDLGFKLGFGGAITYDRALKLRELAVTLPLESIVLETDAPDIPPHWLYTTAEQRAAGQPQGRNTSAELPRIAQEIALLRGMPLPALQTATTANARAALRGLPACPAD